MHRPLLLYIVLIFCFFNAFPQDTIQNEETDAEKKATFYLQRLQEEYSKGEYEVHKQYSDSLYLWAKKTDLPKFQILGMVNQAVYFNNRSDQDKAITLYREALTLTDEIPEDYRTRIIVLVNLGNVYTNIKTYEKAIGTMEEVLSMLDEFEDNPKIRAAALNGLANNYERLGSDEKALEYHIKSKELGEKINNESIIATALSNICDTYYKLGKYEQAAQEGRKALELVSIQGPTKERAWLLANLGRSEAQQGNTEAAIAYLEEARDLAQKKVLPKTEIECQEQLARLYEAEGNLEKAQKAKENYLVLKNTALENAQLATKLDLEQDISEKNELIQSNTSMIGKLQKNRGQLVFWASLAALGLLTVSIWFFRFRRQSESRTLKLQEQFLALKRDMENGTLPEKITTTPYKNSSLTAQDLAKYKKRLVALMKGDKPFLDPELSQSKLAALLGISNHHLSEVLNTGFNQNFYNYINSYRVLEAQDLMSKRKYKDAKVIAVAFDSGFKSKTSFNRIFKEHAGTTPSDYRAKITDYR